VNGNAVLLAHLVKLVDANDTAVREHHRAPCSGSSRAAAAAAAVHGEQAMQGDVRPLGGAALPHSRTFEEELAL
jgi:glycine/D-amino acid oxidase-like deaminating enzyme